MAIYDLRCIRSVKLKTENIGIKVADGTIYSVIEEGFSGQKKLILTTVRDNQTAVQIDLYKGGGEKAEQSNYVGTLVIENIPPAPKGNPEVEVVLGVDDSGNLNARASDILTGERQSLSVSLESLSPQGSYDIPEFAFDEELPESQESESVNDFEQELLTGETYPIVDSDRRREHIERKKRNPLFLIGFVVLCLFLIAILAFFIYRGLQGTGVPGLRGGSVGELPAGNNGGTAAEPPPPAEEKTETAEEKAVEQSAPGQRSSPTRPGVWYKIKRGDTLWDISGTYYRNPWLFPKIARENRIMNPDIIFADQKIFIPEN